MLDITIDGGDATELAEMLQFLADWLAADRDQMDASLTRCVGNPAYGADQLQTDLRRFIFLLRGDDGDQLFGDHANQPPLPKAGDTRTTARRPSRMSTTQYRRRSTASRQRPAHNRTNRSRP